MKNEKQKRKREINFGNITKNHSLSIDKEACGRKLNCELRGTVREEERERER